MKITENSNGLVDVLGFEIAGVSCDIRNKGDNRLDMALVHSKVPAVCAGVFTTNDVRAAPVELDKEHLKISQTQRAIIINSGNANACTGLKGMDDAQDMCALVADKLGVLASEVLVCSTGRIGELMPMAKIEKGISEAVANLNSTQEEGDKAARAILTSDTRKKTISIEVEHEGKAFHLSAMAKGAGMIEPNMATMLAFIATDADISKDLLKKTLSRAVEMTFNCISVDGDMSTNDTVLVMANAMSGVKICECDAQLVDKFAKALEKICAHLAKLIVGDGERITKVVQININNAASQEQAKKVAKSIANSLLVKSSWYGSDPNWGRLADAAGYARTGIDFDKMDIYYNDVVAIQAGSVFADNKPQWKEVVANKEFTININLNLGEESWTVLSTDLSEAYVDFNKAE
ncbi:MAG: bifunctional glutamate N-acetyltransferase/amino-acid acetyltransferase ArgJ [Opitutales bacterium]